MALAWWSRRPARAEARSRRWRYLSHGVVVTDVSARGRRHALGQEFLPIREFRRWPPEGAREGGRIATRRTLRTRHGPSRPPRAAERALASSSTDRKLGERDIHRCLGRPVRGGLMQLTNYYVSRAVANGADSQGWDASPPTLLSRGFRDLTRSQRRPTCHATL